MDDLKKVFEASRALQGHSSIEKAADHMGYSKTTVDKFFAGALDYPSKVRRAIIEYCYEAGLKRNIKELGLDPNATKDKLATSK